MIFPIRSEEGATRQLPWVTWAVAALCAVVFAFTDPEPAQEIATPDRSLAEAASYWRERGYLEAAKEVVAEVGRDVDAEFREKYLDTLRTRAIDWRPDEAQFASEQSELDRMTELALGQSAPPEAEISPFFQWGLTASTPSFSALATHPFLHSGWVHLLGNLLLFLLVAPALEDRWGRGLFAGGLAGLAVAGAGAHLFLATGPETILPLVGATSLVAGTMGAFLTRLWSTQVEYFYFFGANRSGSFDMPGWLMLPLWVCVLGVQALFASALTAPIHWALLGSFVTGAAAAGMIRRIGIENDFSGTETTTTRQTARTASGPGKQLDAPNLLELVRKQAERGETEAAARNWLELNSRFPETLVASPTLVKIAPALVARARAEALRQALDPANQGLTSGMALRILEEERAREPQIALQAAERALQIGNLPAGKRGRVETAIDVIEARIARDLAAADANATADEGAAGTALAAPGDAAHGAAPDARAAAPASPLPPIANKPTAAAASGHAGDPDADLPAFPDAPVVPSAPLRKSAAPLPENDAPVLEGRASSTAETSRAAEPHPTLGGPLAAVSSAPTARKAASSEVDELPALKTTPAVQTSPSGDVALPSASAPPTLPGDAAPAPARDTAPASHGGIASTASGDANPVTSPGVPVEDRGLRAVDPAPLYPDLKLMEATPLRLGDVGLELRAGGREFALAFDKISAVASAIVADAGAKPVLLIDLVLTAAENEPLRSVRLRSDGFDPRAFVPGVTNPVAALRQLLERIVDASHATGLPDPGAAVGRSFARFDRLVDYEREVLSVDR